MDHQKTRRCGLWACITADWCANRKNVKGQLVCLLFRLAHWLRCTHPITFAIGLPYLVFYRLSVEWVLGIEIPPLTKIGPGLTLNHGQGLVVNNMAQIGANCRLRQGVTIGNKGDGEGCPILGDGVQVGANALILGEIHIGEDSIVGAGSVVTKNVPEGTVVVGNPARPLRQ